jgi:hypothetical protein
METNDDRIALGALRFLGELYDITADFSRRLREEFGMDGKTRKGPTSRIECRSYRTGVVIHTWVEAMLQGQNSLTCELDIRQHAKGWLVDARICSVEDSGTNTRLQLVDEIVPTFADVARDAPTILTRLYDAGIELLKAELYLG